MMASKVFIAISLIIFSLVACQSDAEIEFQRYYVTGKNLYEINCQNCHGANGDGLGKLYPPLTDEVFLQKNRNKLYCMIKNGIEQEMVINGVTFQGKMPGNNQLADIEIAEIITYITNSFGNKQVIYTTVDAGGDRANCN